MELEYISYIHLYNFGWYSSYSWMNKGNIHSKTLVGYLLTKKFRFDFLGLNLRTFLLVI